VEELILLAPLRFSGLATADLLRANAVRERELSASAVASQLPRSGTAVSVARLLATLARATGPSARVAWMPTSYAVPGLAMMASLAPHELSRQSKSPRPMLTASAGWLYAVPKPALVTSPPASSPATPRAAAGAVRRPSGIPRSVRSTAAMVPAARAA